MSWLDFFIIFFCCVVTMLASRVIPLFVLKGKELPPSASEALSFIPPAAFAALVANDLFSPTLVDTGISSAMVPLLAAALVVFVAWKTKSLIWSIVSGVVAYAVFSLLFGIGL